MVALGAVVSRSLSEGIQKFLFSAALGVGRFEKIGIPFPAVAAPFVGVIEVTFGMASSFPALSRPPVFLLRDLRLIENARVVATLRKFNSRFRSRRDHAPYLALGIPAKQRHRLPRQFPKGFRQAMAST